MSLNNIEKFRFWAHKVLPLVYDDSLSYYEFLCKVVAKLNEVIALTDEQNEEISSQTDLINELNTKMNEWETDKDANFVAFVNQVNAIIDEFMQQVCAPFNENTSYARFDFVEYDKKIYQCVVDTTTAGQPFNPDEWNNVTVIEGFSYIFNELYDNINIIINNLFETMAAPFDATKSYNVGDYMSYNNMIFRCINAGAHAFDADNWTAVTDFFNDFINTYTSEILENITAGGRNLIINTYQPNVDNANNYPRIIGQSGATSVSGTQTVATHGFRTTLSASTFPRMRFGANSGSMNGFTAGETYSISFVCKFKLYSNDTASSTSHALRLNVYTDTSGSMANTAFKTISNIAQSDKGVEKTVNFTFTFTVPANATQAYMIISPNVTTASMFAVGDFIEVQNIILQVGNLPTSWSPAPEDLVTPMTIIYDNNTLLGGGELNYNFAPFKLIRIYYRMPALQGDFDLNLSISGDTTLGSVSGFDPHYAGITAPTADDVGLYTLLVSVNEAKTKLTVREWGFREWTDMTTLVDRSNNNNYYIYKIEGFAELQ